MKNDTKNKLLIASAIVSLASIMSFKTMGGEKEIIIVRTVESENSMFSSSVIVTDAKKTIKIVELDAMRPKNMESNLIKITAVLNECRQQGYKLIEANSGAGAFNVGNYIFEKE